MDLPVKCSTYPDYCKWRFLPDVSCGLQKTGNRRIALPDEKVAAREGIGHVCGSLQPIVAYHHRRRRRQKATIIPRIERC